MVVVQSREGISHAALSWASQFLSKRQIQQLDDASLLPKNSKTCVLKRVAVVGAFYKSGVPLVASGNIGSLCGTICDTPDGEAQSQLREDFARAKLDGFEFDRRSLSDRSGVLTDEFKLYVALKEWDKFNPLQARDNDIVIEVLEGELIAVGLVKDRFKTHDTDEEGFSIFGRLKDWERGSDAIFEKFEPPEAPTNIFNIRKNAIGKIQVNVSLAIRKTFESHFMYLDDRGEILR